MSMDNTPTEILETAPPIISHEITIHPPSTVSRPKRSIILFDGVCNVCNTFVQFVYARDKKKRFYYQAAQSKKGREIFTERGIPPTLDTIVLIDEEEDKYYTKSSAIFMILYHLQDPWSYLYYLIYLPRHLRDFGYSSFAAVRYVLFGKKDECGFYPGLKDQFIDWRSPIIELEDNKDM